MCKQKAQPKAWSEIFLLQSVCVLVLKWGEKGVHRVRSFWKFSVGIARVSCRGLTNGLRVFIILNRIGIPLNYGRWSNKKICALVSFLIELMAWRHHNLPLHRLILLLKIHFIHTLFRHFTHKYVYSSKRKGKGKRWIETTNSALNREIVGVQWSDEWGIRLLL